MGKINIKKFVPTQYLGLAQNEKNKSIHKVIRMENKIIKK